MKVVHVRWKDPGISHSAWIAKDELKEWVGKGFTFADSIGMLAIDEPTHIVLLLNVGECQVAGAVMIARECIQFIKELSEVDVTLDL
jgi:hypothetical protein